LTRPIVVLFGTLDTKGTEYDYVRRRLLNANCDVVLIDTGVLGVPQVPYDIGRHEVAEAADANVAVLADAGDRGSAVATMAIGAARIAAKLHAQGKLDAVLGLGGSNAAHIIGAVAAALPIGVPKMLVSTLAAGDTRPYVGTSDLTLMYPVVDMSGLNRVSRRVLSNAAAACAAMASVPTTNALSDAPLVAISMFGVTTTCGTRIRDLLANSGIEALTFHATGVGGKSMETLIRSGYFRAVADITTTELADDLVGGVCSAGPDRLSAAAESGVPQVVSLGALDMVNFGPRDTVPARFAGRVLLQHNPDVTLMRTSSEECAALGHIIASKLNAATGPVELLIPLRGFSQVSAPGQPFNDVIADRALIDNLRAHLEDHVVVREFDTHINDPRVAAAAATTIASWIGDRKESAL
jgi:uncharacterized protein (UPF0261 family)